jgi:chromosomal replication initiator protein
MNNINPKELWKSVITDIQLSHAEGSASAYSSLLSKTSVEKIHDDVIEVICPDEFTKRNIQKKLSADIQKSLEKILKKETEISFKIGKTKPSKEGFRDDTAPLFQSQKNIDDQIKERAEKSGLVPKFTFDRYILGSSNQLAFAIAKAVSEKPGEAYNPVFLYAGVGLGKTHLVHAIGNYIIRNKPTLKVIYTTGESFTNELIEALQSGRGNGGRYSSNEFRNKYRKADVLLIDDVQFIIGKNTTQEEFFHTFNTLYMAQKQIVITSDRPPKDFQNLEQRITSRFSSGIIVDIQPPDFEMRSAILRNKRDQNQDPIPNSVIDLIAEKVATNTRELEGAYLQVLTKVTASGLGASPEIAAQILGQTIKETPTKSINASNIIKTVCTYYSIKSADIKGERRIKDLVIPRQVAMYLIKEMTNIPLMAIGDLLGGRDHTTIMHGIKKVEDDIKTQGKTKQDISNLKRLMEAQGA